MAGRLPARGGVVCLYLAIILALPMPSSISCPRALHRAVMLGVIRPDGI
jgi:hypothetical protein